MTGCNFQEAYPDIADFYFCELTKRKCAGAGCVFQRILEALPLSSPIVTQAMDAIGTGPGDVVPVFPESITYQTEEAPGTVSAAFTPEKTQRIERYPPSDYTQIADVAKRLGITVQGLRYRADKLGVGSTWGARGTLYFSTAEVKKLKAWKKGKHQGKRQVEKKVDAEVETAATETDLFGLSTPNPETSSSPSLTDRALETIIMREYRSHAYIKLEPDVVAKKLNLDPKRVRAICELLNEEEKLHFAGANGYYSRDPLPQEGA